MTITFVFALLRLRFVSLDHLEKEWISFSILLILACRSLVFHTRHDVVSSTYCKHSLSDVIWDISATHRLINIGPNIKPCDTPNSDVNVRQFVQNAVKKLSNLLSNIKSRMYES